MQKRTNHYKIFEFDEKQTNRFSCQDSHNYIDYDEPHKEQDTPIRIDMNEMPEYQLELVKGQLRVVVYEEGLGRYPGDGEFLEYRKRMYWEVQGGVREAGSGVVYGRYGRREQPEVIELVLAISKCRFKARVFLGPKFSQKLSPEIPKGTKLILQLYLVSISEYPLNDSFLQLTKFHNEILKTAIEADTAFSTRNLSLSLTLYEKAIDHIFSDYCLNALSRHKKTITKEDRETLRMLMKRERRQERENQLDQMVRNKETVGEMEDIGEKIAMKGVEVAVVAGEMWKVVKWARLLMANPKYQYNVKLLLMRARAFIELEQYTKAETDLKEAINLAPHNKIPQDQLASLYKIKASQSNP